MKNKVNSLYNRAERFAEITKKALIAGNVVRAKNCLNLAERLFINGSTETKGMIANVYLYSLCSFMKLKNCTISNLFPQNLKLEYNRQLIL
ncbi:DUF7674 family protein [Flavobacterium sp. TMP13]|uniref:DUF7674 family protein n=1 Tax=unclassified Flavobacterium TaxID=196869 RepID=UPI00076D18EE|nr:hypothetical protein [Flavobacterium sp. TAB 87]KVV14817.1 hypothetical protein AP058_01873 [Flavobacterium sp. TAB 87]